MSAVDTAASTDNINLDSLTGLPGRATLLTRLDTLPPATQAALLCIDLEQLAALNETMGLSARDVLLAETAQRIAVHLGESDFLARYGGDRFAWLMLTGVTQDKAERITSRLIEDLRRPYLVAGREIFVSASAGLAYQTDVDEKGLPFAGDQLLQHAEAALAQAKSGARGSWLGYEPGMAGASVNRLNLDAELSQAVEQGQFQVYFQPKASCRSGAIIGFEALLRWLHPVKGIVSPTEFVPALEARGLIDKVGAWVLRKACQQLKAWDSLGHDRLKMAVNVSLRQLDDPSFPELVDAVLSEFGIAAERIELELTESILMQDAVRAEASLFRLKALGVRLSIDDFGTGYSSLAYLKRLPIDTVKIDRSFVRDITTNPNDASITRAIISMAHSLNLTLVAEGVETDAQLSILVAAQCETVQGYLIGRPMTADEALNKLASGWSLPAELLNRPTRLRTLLLVDDEESILLALKRLLRREGYRILTANSGSEGLELLAKNDVDVIVSDQRMPNMTGEEFLRLAKELYPETVRMVLSGYADMQSITNAINQGAIYKFLSKPWEDQALKENILDAFSRKEMSDENHRLTLEIASKNEDLNHSNAALASLLDEQSRRSQVGQMALSVAQETLHMLPIPLLCLDPTGMIVLRNEAFSRLGIYEDIGSAIEERLPSWPSTEPFTFEYVDSSGRHWKMVGRHLSSGGHHSGMVFAFFPEALSNE
ncbi:MAG: EAL domain-containing protein [Rhodoferax sp.]|nr:EAL domain-containing protein [Rhodoferax sp.]